MTNTQNMHPHAIRWGLVFVALVVLTLVMLVAGPAAHDQPAPDDAVQEETGE